MSPEFEDLVARKRAAMLAPYGGAKLDIHSHFINPAPTMTNPTDRIKQAEAELAAAIKAKEEQDERDALAARVEHDRSLAAATLDLLVLIGDLKGVGKIGRNVQPQNLAKFRKELQPLAESYGVKIVPVGDKTTATVVLA